MRLERETMLNIYKIYKYFVILCVICAIVQSCNIINPKEQVPTYIHIDSFQFEGAATHEISAIVVYYNNNPVGSFDLPATFPIIATGTGSLLITPAINSNGQNDRLTQYPFYTQDTSTFTAQPGKVINYTPKTTYVASAKFYTISDFEYGQIKLTKAAGDVAITDVTDPSLIFQGNGTGSIYLAAVGDSSVDSSNTPFNITPGAAFIEFDYRTEIPFDLALQSNLGALYNSGANYIAGVNPVNPTTKWRKFYLDLTGVVNQTPGDNYTFFMNAYLADSQTHGRLLIDNIKLVTF